MIADLSEWLADVAARAPVTLPRTVHTVGVTGVRDAHVGPRWDKAQVSIVAERADRWSAEVELPGTERLTPEQAVYLREATLGIIDVLATRPPQPLLNVKLRIIDAEFDPVASNARAFRLAGRDAAEKLLAAVKAI